MVARSIGSRMDASGAVGSGFDALRLALACGVVIYHSFGVAATVGNIGPFELIADSIVPAFFVLSGFLVTASAQRCTLPQFLANRALRILPALIALVTISALVLGPALTSLDLAAYYSSPRTWDYFLAIVGFPQMELPGVFSGPHVEGAAIASLHANRTFNVSLWTVGWEMFCYAMVAAFMVTRHLSRPAFILSLFVAVMAFRLGLYLARPDVIQIQDVALGPILFPGLEMQNLVPGRTFEPWTPNWINDQLAARATSWEFRVIPFFLVGMLAYLWRYEVERSRLWALASAAAIVAVSCTISGERSTPLTTVLTAAPIAYLVAYVGTAHLPLPRLIRGDYSYGVYLWAFPVQQWIHMRGLDNGSPWANMLIALPIALLAGCASWHLVERPVLAKSRFKIGRFKLTAEAAS
jgi:peptidoglycan/LPS O-acetylase OafA/YrhL